MAENREMSEPEQNTAQMEEDFLAMKANLQQMLPAAALPILFHFFLRFRTRPAVFSTLMFFDAIDPRMRARRRIHEWLVLLLRCLFLALMLAALSRPVWMGGRGGGRTAAVLVIATWVPYWLSAVIVGGVAVIVGLIMVQGGRSALKNTNITPEKTVDTMKENAQWVKEKIQ